MTRARDNSNILGTASANTGGVLTSDSSQTNGYAFENTAQYAAGKNFIINGLMEIWQRGTSFSGLVYTADRWQATYGTGVTVAQSTDTPNVNFPYSLQISGSNYATIGQRIESVNSKLLTNQTITVSFWAKGSASTSVSTYLQAPSAIDNWSNSAFLTGGATFTVGTTWNKYSVTYPAANLISNVSNGLMAGFNGPSGSSTFYVTGVQLELGSVATPLSRAGGTIAGEIAACQRYYYRLIGASLVHLGWAQIKSTTTVADCFITFPTQMRTSPIISEYSGIGITAYYGAPSSISATPTIDFCTPYSAMVNMTAASSLGTTQAITAAYASNGYLGFSAEL